MEIPFTTMHERGHSEYSAIATNFLEARWYAVYTSANHEKRVAKQLEQRSVQHFLPLYESVRRWKDRRVKLGLPLFPGYIFVRMAIADRSRVLQVPGVVRLVGFNGQPYPLSEEDIQAVRNCLRRGYQVEPHPYVRVGRRARVKAGPLKGLEGIILRRKNRMRFVLSLELIMRSVAVEMDGSELEPVKASLAPATPFREVAQSVFL